MTSFVVLRHQPRSVYVKLTDCDIEFLPPQPCRLHTRSGADRACPACDFLPGVLAVKPCTNQQAWSVNITCITDGSERSVRVRRTQLPLVCLKASTLHVLQGTTTDPGLIFHWAVPRKFRRDICWLAVNVALSRMRRLKSLRSIGMNNDTKAIMEAGPPKTLPAQFHKLFSEKEKQTALDVEAAMTALGWQAGAVEPCSKPGDA